jgi:hypothetical protein
MTDTGPRLCINCRYCVTINSQLAILTYHECDHPSSVVHPAVNLVTGASLVRSTRRMCGEARGGLYGPECGAAARFFEAREPRDPSFLEVTGLDEAP